MINIPIITFLLEELILYDWVFDFPRNEAPDFMRLLNICDARSAVVGSEYIAMCAVSFTIILHLSGGTISWIDSCVSAQRRALSVENLPNWINEARFLVHGMDHD